LIEIKDLYFSYDTDTEKKNFILNGIDLTIKSGEFVTIMGSNGSGKSSLVLCIKGILKPVSGDIIIDGIDISDEKKSEKVKRDIGIVFQNPDNQFISTSVEREIAFGLENLGISRDEMRRRINEQMQKFNIKKYKNNSPDTLSGGEKQRVSLSSVLVTNPRYIILDEATSYLDPAERESIINFLKEESFLKKARGFTILLITQFPSEALLAERLIIMDEGKIIKDGKPNDIFRNVKELQSMGVRVPVEYEVLY